MDCIIGHTLNYLGLRYVVDLEVSTKQFAIIAHNP